MPLPTPLEAAVACAVGGALLDVRLYIASPPVVGDAPHRLGAAVVAHPYAPLGGTFDDPIVSLTARQLYEAGYTVLTFNFRQRTSWTSKPELSDYATVTRFLIYFLLLSSDAPPLAVNVILAGYSYGSMIASQTPSVQTLVGGASEDETNSIVSSVRKMMNIHIGSKVLDESILSAIKPSIMTRYLLISPILPPVTTLLTCSLRSLDYGFIKTHSTLAVFGTKDHFTSGKKLLKWAQALGLRYEQVNGAGHFWLEENAARRLKEAVSAFARDLEESSVVSRNTS